MLVDNINKNPQGRRFTHEGKIIALSIFKRSAKCYRFLRKFLPLPSNAALKALLRNVVMDTGITKEAIQRLEEAAKNAKESQKMVILMWDELKLSLGLHYDKDNDKFVGFEDWGNVRTQKYADEGLVFMLRVMETGDIVPISFNFCSKQTTTPQLINCIKETIKTVSDVGFKIVATVCDGGTGNQSALATLLEDTKKLMGEEYVLRCEYLLSITFISLL